MESDIPREIEFDWVVARARELAYHLPCDSAFVLGVLLDPRLKSGSLLANLGLDGQRVQAELHEPADGPPDHRMVLERALALAQEEADLLRSNTLGSEHILLGLLHFSGTRAAVALNRRGITLERVRAALDPN